MFDPSSRYYPIAATWLETANRDGAPPIEVRYVRRRLIPRSDDTLVLTVHRTVDGDRLDNITAKNLGDPTLFWRVCDASGAGSSEELERPGSVVRIPAF